MVKAPTSMFVGRAPLANARIMVEMFDGTGHFGMWQSELQDALFQQGLDVAIEGTKPEEMEETEWKTINRLACGTIRSCLSRDQKYPFSKETSASKLWKALEEKFLKKSSQNKLHLKRKLFRFEYVAGTTMNDHITSFNQLITDLLNMDVTFEDEDLALMLLGSLPGEFEHLETTLLHGRTEVSLSEVTAALYSHEFRKNEKKESTSKAEQILVVRGRPQSRKKGKKERSKSRQKPKKDECAYCLQKGHWKKNCPKLKNEGKSNKGRAVVSNIAEVDDDSDFSLAVVEEDSNLDLLSGVTTADPSSTWILDSGCSFHMCPNREWFSDFKKVEGPTFYVANDNPCISKGIGTIRLRDQDGTLRTLNNVRYVPDLRRNLISTGSLEMQGHRIV